MIRAPTKFPYSSPFLALPCPSFTTFSPTNFPFSSRAYLPSKGVTAVPLVEIRDDKTSSIKHRQHPRRCAVIITLPCIANSSLYLAFSRGKVNGFNVYTSSCQFASYDEYGTHKNHLQLTLNSAPVYLAEEQCGSLFFRAGCLGSTGLVVCYLLD